MHLTKQLMKNNDILQDWKPNKGFQSFLVHTKNSNILL
ncbi:Uncharacterised protein [Staphylococcus warneri]|nr:Uncharacterised protein [Staphylococcus warneri]SUN00969.1 Uncharacterised protein [Staphylococcus warneri]VED28342.1 Uncharacterised protein [Staphylococcus warneri]VED32191.1 Uncharacterised protein [Staphylococcus warneri]VED74492.1 Uncharacterised protein [Staphylococcus warneri]